MSGNEMELATALLILPGLLIVGGIAVVVATILRNGKLAELQHRERMAMIERGMTPPAEQRQVHAGPRGAHGFKLSLGIMLCGFGLALGMLIAFAAGAEDVALGVGGAFVMLGLAFVVAGLVARTLPSPPSPGPMPPPRPIVTATPAVPHPGEPYPPSE